MGQVRTTVPQQPQSQQPQQQQQPQRPQPKRGASAVKEALQLRLEVIQSVIPKGSMFTAQGLVNNAMAIILEDRYLMMCTPRSALLAVLAAARFGFSFCGDDAYLIPYEKTQDDGNGGRAHLEWQCKFMPGYKGLIDLAARNGFSMYAQDVWECDRIRIIAGTEQKVEHEMGLAQRGNLVGAYCLVNTTEGKPVGLSRIFFEEIPQLEQNTPAWKKWKGRMVLKSCVKRAFGLLPKGNTDLRLLEELDNRAEAGQDIGDLVDAEDKTKD